MQVAQEVLFHAALGLEQGSPLHTQHFVFCTFSLTGNHSPTKSLTPWNPYPKSLPPKQHVKPEANEHPTWWPPSAHPFQGSEEEQARWEGEMHMFPEGHTPWGARQELKGLTWRYEETEECRVRLKR